MTISVIIPTYNGAHKITNILDSLLFQTLIPNEVIVVIDGSTDNTKEIILARDYSSLNLKIIEQANGGRAQVRNTGANEASGKLLIFFDDDMRLLPNCVEEHYVFHQQSGIGIVTGGLKEEILPDSNEMVKFKSYLSDKWNAELIKTEGKPMSDMDAFITAANFSIESSLFKQLGGFDIRLNDAEDHDLTMRAIKACIPIYYHYKAFAWHDDLLTAAVFIKRMREYGKAQIKLSILRPEYPPKYQMIHPIGWKAHVFKFFCYRFWISSIDNSVWKNILPKRLRYKLYDIIITANGTFYPEKVPL